MDDAAFKLTEGHHDVIKVERLFMHPFKGLRPIEQKSVELKSPAGIPFDRAFAFAFQDELDAHNVNLEEATWLSKSMIANQMDWAALAALSYDLDFESWKFALKFEEAILATGSLSSDQDRKTIAAALTKYMASKTPNGGARHPQASPLTLLGGPATRMRFPDREKYAVSLLNLASLEALKSQVSCDIDIRAFRGNIVVSGIEAWEEQKWVGKKLKIGNSKIQISAPIARCNNINVHPESAVLDSKILATLAKLQRGRFGMMATVEVDGPIHCGDVCELED